MGNTCSTNSRTSVVPVEQTAVATATHSNIDNNPPSLPSIRPPSTLPSPSTNPTFNADNGETLGGSTFYHEPNSAFRDGHNRKSPLLTDQLSQSPTKSMENNNNKHVTDKTSPPSIVSDGSATTSHHHNATNTTTSNNKKNIQMTSLAKSHNNGPTAPENDIFDIPTMASMRASSILRPSPTGTTSPRAANDGASHNSVDDANIDKDSANNTSGPPLFSSEFMTGRLSSLTNTPVNNSNAGSIVSTTDNKTTGSPSTKKKIKTTNTGSSTTATGPTMNPSEPDKKSFKVPMISTDEVKKTSEEDIKSYVDIMERDSSTATINDSSAQGLNSTIGSPTELISPTSAPSTFFTPGSSASASTGEGTAIPTPKAAEGTTKSSSPFRRASQFAPLPLRKGESVKFIINKAKGNSNEQATTSAATSSSPRRSPISSPVEDFECEFVEDINDRYLIDPVALGKGSFGEVLLAWRTLPRLENENEETWKERCRKGPAVALKRVQPAPERLSAVWKHQKSPPHSNKTSNPETNPSSIKNHPSNSGKESNKTNIRIFVPSSTLVRDASSVHSEARILYRVRNCDYVVRLLDYCVDNSHVYIGMEHCGGGDLMKFVLQCRNFSERVAAYLFKQMLLGVSHCHSVGVVHRDLKPDNFLFASAEGKAHLKICDFGLATIVSSRDKLMQDAVGSAFFIAPEVFSRNYTLACDAWSLGINLYLLLSGTVPFGATATRAVDVHRSIQHDPLSFHGKAWTNISTSAKELVSGLLDKHPHRRYTVEQALQHPWVSGDTAPDTPLDSHVVQNMVKWVNQNRLRKEAVKLVATTLTAADVRKLREQFHAIDTNSDLAISPAELTTALTKLGANLGYSSLSIDQLVKAMDTDGDGVINLDEFLAATAELQMVAHQTQMWWAFCQYDRNGDGLIDLNEAKAVLGDTEDLSTVAAQIAQYDVDGDGRINYEEFLKMLVPEGIHFSTLHFVDNETDDDENNGTTTE